MSIHKSRMRGVSLIELLVSLSVAAIALSIALPSWDQVRQKRHVSSAAEQIAAFVSSVQGDAIKHNEELTVNLVHGGSTDWCLGAVLGSIACDCTKTDPSDAAFCAIDGATQVVSSQDFALASMPSHSTDTSFTFEPVRGLMVNADLGTQHHFNLLSRGGLYGLRVSLLPTGRVRLCNFDSDARVPGYADCSAASEGRIGG